MHLTRACRYAGIGIALALYFVSELITVSTALNFSAIVTNGEM